MTIRIGAFHHAALNLNGDLQNILVLAKRLNARGLSCEVIELNGSNFESEFARGLSLAFVGHGSEAAWAAIDSSDTNFESSLLALADAGVPILGVSSGFERLIQIGLTDLTLTKKERRSEFVQVEWNAMEIIGYLNSDLEAPLFYRRENIFGTLLHGPLLAKNPLLADYFIEMVTNSPMAQADAGSIEILAELDALANMARDVAKGMFS